MRLSEASSCTLPFFFLRPPHRTCISAPKRAGASCFAGVGAVNEALPVSLPLSLSFPPQPSCLLRPRCIRALLPSSRQRRGVPAGLASSLSDPTASGKISWASSLSTRDPASPPSSAACRQRGFQYPRLPREDRGSNRLPVVSCIIVHRCIPHSLCGSSSPREARAASRREEGIDPAKTTRPSGSACFFFLASRPEHRLTFTDTRAGSRARGLPSHR